MDSFVCTHTNISLKPIPKENTTIKSSELVRIHQICNDIKKIHQTIWAVPYEQKSLVHRQHVHTYISVNEKQLEKIKK